MLSPEDLTIEPEESILGAPREEENPWDDCPLPDVPLPDGVDPTEEPEGVEDSARAEVPPDDSEDHPDLWPFREPPEPEDPEDDELSLIHI